MNRGRGVIGTRAGGYTIVETLIFLAASSVMVITAFQLVHGQTNKAEFVNAVRDFQSQITNTITDVSTGYYAQPGSTGCSVVSSLPKAGPGITSDGTCTFIGSVVKFGGNGGSSDADTYLAIPMAGLRTSAGSTDPINLGEAKPVAFDMSTALSSITKSTQYGSNVSCVKVGSGACNAANNAAIGFFTKPNPTGAGVVGQSLQMYLVPFDTVSLANTFADTITRISSGSGGADYAALPVNPDGGVAICLVSGGTDQHAWIHVGGKGNSSSVYNEIKDGVACT